jgi:alkylated DNA repair protein alkB family protein 8
MAHGCDCAFKNYCDSTNSSSALANNADDIEKTHVFEVYDRIASHFSDTRHKPWPNVESFVRSFPTGSVL